MASIYVRKDTNALAFNFTVRGHRFREQTAYKDTLQNRKRLKAVLTKIQAEIALDTFEYAHYFPNSPNIKVFERLGGGRRAGGTPLFSEFVAQWIVQMQVRWKESHTRTVQQNIDQCLLPYFGDMEIDRINRNDVLQFRADFGAGKYSKNNREPGNNRVNKVFGTLQQIMQEAALRQGFESPAKDIPPLKETTKPVEPLTWSEVKLFLDNVRPDFRNYYIVRFLTGLRTGEIDGLRWESVDFERREIIVREAIVNGKMTSPKTATSNRAVRMSALVYKALREQEQATKPRSEYVFCLRNGNPLAHGNVTKRVWYPTLKLLGLKRRKAYQTRHTAATLWVAAGENPEWVARQLGHANTLMLFKVYSRYIPNATRQDGSAFDKVMEQQLGTSPSPDES